MDEFYRMSDQFYWDNETKLAARQTLQNAIAHQFNSIYGTDINDIKAWQNLCQVIGIAAPEGIKACREVSRFKCYHSFRPVS